MGGGLLQKVNRDTMSFATKLSHIVYADGSRRDIMKAPSGDASKASLPGVALHACGCLKIASSKPTRSTGCLEVGPGVTSKAHTRPPALLSTHHLSSE